MGIAALKQCEGAVIRNGMHVIYDDKTGRVVPENAPLPPGATIGYGHLVLAGEDFRNGISEVAATELLRHDIAVAESAVNNCITAPLRQNQFDALVMLAYNIGADNFANSTVVKYINNPEYRSTIYPSLESAWRAWNRSGGRIMPGLRIRRDTEWKIFNQ